MTTPENNVTRLADLMGGMAAIARACGVHRSLVARWKVTTGLIPWKYNKAIRAWVWGSRTVDTHPNLADAVNECLSNPTCPTCGQPVDGGQVL